MIDLYCERVAPGLLGEPVNALSNLAFLAAAWLAWKRLPPRADRSLRALTLLIAAIGVGSALFHLTAARWAQVLDVAPIAGFQVLWIWTYARRVAGCTAAAAVAILAIFGSSVAVGSLSRHLLNGAPPYLPALAVLAACGIHHRVRTGSNLLLAALAGFAGALLFRTVDLAACGVVPFGTHFLWHLLNAPALLLSFLVLTGSDRPATS